MTHRDHPDDTADTPADDMDTVRSEYATSDDLIRELIDERQSLYGHELTATDIEYIFSGVITETSQGQSDVEGRVNEKAGELSERLHVLLTDIAMLYVYSDGDLGTYAPNAWSTFIDCHDPLLHQLVDDHVVLPERESSSPKLILGYELGFLARLLLETETRSIGFQTTDWKEVIRGFTYAFFEHPERATDGDSDNYEAMLHYLEAAEERRRAHLAGLEARAQALVARFTDERTEGIIRSNLRQHGLPVTKTLIETIRSEVPEEDIADTRAAVEQIVTGIDADAIANAVDTREAIEDDANRLAEISEYQGVVPSDVLTTLFNSERPQSLDAVGNKLHRTTQTPKVKAVLNRLVADQRGDTWTTCDVVMDKSSGWTLTPYGLCVVASFQDQSVLDEIFGEYYRYLLRNAVPTKDREEAIFDGRAGTPFDGPMAEAVQLAIKQYLAAIEDND